MNVSPTLGTTGGPAKIIAGARAWPALGRVSRASALAGSLTSWRRKTRRMNRPLQLGLDASNEWESLRFRVVLGHFGPRWFLPFIGAAKAIDRLR